MIHIGFSNHFVHRYFFVKVTTLILRSGDCNTCLICYIEERERMNNKKKQQKVHVSDDHYHGLHSTFNYLSKQERKRRFVYFISMSDTTTNYDCIVTIVYNRTHSLTPPSSSSSPPPSSSKHWISRARTQYRALSLIE